MPGPEKGRDTVEDEEDETEGGPEDLPTDPDREAAAQAEDEDDGEEEDEDDDEEEAEDHRRTEERMVSCAEQPTARPASPDMTLPAPVKAEPEAGDSDADPADLLPPQTDRKEEETQSPRPRLTDSPAPSSPLDFSMKKGSEPGTEVKEETATDDEGNRDAEDGPLDLSVPRRRKGGSSAARKHKAAKPDPALPKPSSPWGYNVPKALPPAAPLVSGKHESLAWNGKVKSHHHHHHHGHSDRTQSQGAQGKVFQSAVNRKQASPTPVAVPDLSCGSGKSLGGAGRQNPWQTQWMSKSGEQAKDVFTCVWCKESFRSLAEMTVHMKQSPRCGMAGMQASSVPPPVSPQPSPSVKCGGTSSGGGCSSGGGSGVGSGGSSIPVKESMPLPRKLVRGQDVWLGKGAEQTRQILKCMWCGQSFKTLADMTTHMRVTQHYTNIISQEQIISWRTPEDKVAAQSQVNAVLTCKVCDQAFGSLKELSYHMVKNSHYKEHILRSISEGGGRRRQTRERRKKSLPVRKLLELERMEMGKQGHHSNREGAEGVARGAAGEPAADGKITCEECAEKVDAKDFVQHIKSCSAQRNNHQRIKTEVCEESGDEGTAPAQQPATTNSSTPAPERVSSPESKGTREGTTPGPAGTGSATPTPEGGEERPAEGTRKPGETSVLNAIERLIEKSFEYKGRRGQATTGILQRLGIDEEVYPPWHPANSPGGKGSSSLLVKGSDRAKSTSPLRFEPGDLSRHEELSRKRLFEAYNHVSASSETSRGSTPISLMNTSSPTRSLTESPHRTHSSMTGSTAGSPPPSPHSYLLSPKPAAGGEEGVGEGVAPRSPKNGRPDTDGSMCGSPKHFEVRPSRCSSVSSFDGRRSPLSDVEPVRPPSAEPLELKASSSSTSGAAKRKRPKSRHERSKGAKRWASARGDPADEKRSVSADSIMSSVSSSEGGGAKAGSELGSDHPLKELQKLLDKTDAHLSRPALPSGPGSILAFSWACNDVATSDSLMKCAFCETHFISKGAYRHHLSKMHFVKEPLGSPGDSPTWRGAGGDKTKNGSPEVPVAASSSSSSSAAPRETGPSAPAEESPHSKFLKYTELAKQLSSKYV